MAPQLPIRRHVQKVLQLVICVTAREYVRKWEMRNSKCEMRNAKFEMWNSKFGFRGGDCGLRTRSGYWGLRYYGVRTAIYGVRTMDCELLVANFAFRISHFRFQTRRLRSAFATASDLEWTCNFS